MAKLCPACSKANPPTANYCYYDGRHLSAQGPEGPLQVGTLPLPVPFYFPGGQACANFNELALACDARWDEAKSLLADGTWHSYFTTIGRIDLAVAARQAVTGPDLDVGLSQLLEQFPADPTALRRPQLALPSAEEHLGMLTPGTDHRFELMISNRGLLVLRGMATTNCEWLSFGDGTSPGLKMFQTRGIYALPVRVLGNKLRAGAKPLQGEIVIDTNGGAITVPVRAYIPIRPFPGGTQANDVLAGVKSPRELAHKAKANPLGAAVLFEQGAVKAWYASNGWTYPVEGTQASGKSAVQQFFEALGLTKPPRLEIDTQRLHSLGRVGQRDTKYVTVSTNESRVVYAHGWSNQPWITVGSGKSQGNQVAIPLQIEVPPRPGETVHADVTIQGNGNQQFIIPVTLAVVAAPPPAVAAPGVSISRLPLAWMFTGVGVLFLLAIPVTVVALIVTGWKPPQETKSTITQAPPPATVPKTEAWWADLPATKLAASVSELKGSAPQDAAIFDAIAVNDPPKRCEAYENLATITPKLLGNPKAKSPLGRLLTECCVFEPENYILDHLLPALTSQIPKKEMPFQAEGNGEELERGLWSLEVFHAALKHDAVTGRPERVKQLTDDLELAFGLAPDQLKIPPDELKARTRKLLAERCYRNAQLTAEKSVEHALSMRDRLSEKFPEHRSAAFRVALDMDLIAILLSKGDDVWPQLEPLWKACLKSADPEIQQKLADLHQKASPPVATKIDELKANLHSVALIDELKNPDSEVRRGAAQTLAEMGPSATQTVGPLAARLRIETNTAVLAELAHALGQIHVNTSDVVEALHAKATHPNVVVRRPVIEALLKLGPDAVPVVALFRYQGDDNEGIRQLVTKALTDRFTTSTPADLDGAIKALKNDDAKVRCQASRALGLSGPAAKKAAPGLGTLLETETEPPVLVEAARSLRFVLLRSDSKDVLKALNAKVNHADPDVRFAVVQSLIALQGERISLKFLFGLAEDGNPDIKQCANGALMQRLNTVTDADVPDLRQGLNGHAPPIQRAVVEALGRVGKAAAAAADDLVPLLEENTVLLVRYEAAIALVLVNREHKDVAKKAVPSVVAAFGRQSEEKSDGAEFTGRCERARKAVLTLVRPPLSDLVDAISPRGQFNGPKPDFAARIEVYRTLEELGAEAQPEVQRIAEQVKRENVREVVTAADRALAAIKNARP